MTYLERLNDHDALFRNGESLNQPLMLVFEDLHRIDDESQALLNLLADSIGTSREFCCWLTTRPSIRTREAARPTRPRCASINLPAKRLQ